MSGATKKQLLILAGAAVLFVLLFIAPKMPPASAPEENKAGGMAAGPAASNADVSVYLTQASKALTGDDKTTFDDFVKKNAFDSLVSFWDKMKRPDLASYYAEKKAAASNQAALWFTAGNRYYYAIQFTRDKSEVPVLYQSAMRSFEKGLALEPGNTDARIMLASTQVEGGSDPMKGIAAMREIEKTDSNNVKLQLSFAFFSVKSGQMDRAIDRFKKVIRIDSNYIEAYLHLADAYEQRQDKENTILMLEQYARRTGDMTARMEINKYIQQLRTK